MLITVKNRQEKEFLLRLYGGGDFRWYRHEGDFNVGRTINTEHWYLHDTDLSVPATLLARGFRPDFNHISQYTPPRRSLRLALGVPTVAYHKALIIPAKLPEDTKVEYFLNAQ